MNKIFLVCIISLLGCSAVWAVDMPDIDKPIPVKSAESDAQSAVQSDQGLQEINEFDSEKENMKESDQMATPAKLKHLDVGKHDMLIE